MNRSTIHITPKVKTAMLLLLFIFAFQLAFTQGPATKSESISNGAEKVFVHTDKESYLAGEILWFKIYLLNSANAPVNYNAIVYLELINENGDAVLQSKNPATKGTGSGSLFLPVNLSTGSYSLIAYTSQMINEGPQSFFKKRITISNSIAPSASYKKDEQEDVAVNIFPEGGTLVEDIASKTGVQVWDIKKSKGIPARGYILEGETDTIARFETAKFGLGQFSYTPQRGKKYTAIVLADGKPVVKKILPTAKTNGFGLSVTGGVQNNYNINVSSRSVQAQKMLLVAHRSGTTIFATEFNISENQNTDIALEGNKVGPGVTTITLFDQNKQPVCERLLFNPNVPAAVKNINLNVGNTTFSSRQNIALQVEPAFTADSNQIVDGSLSVFSTDGQSATTSIKDYLALTSNLNGTIESPEFYFTPEARNGNLIENLMLVNGWRHFNNISNKQTVKHLPEYSGHIVTAKVTNNWTKQPAAGVEYLLTTPSVPFGLFSGTSDANGIVRFNINKYYGPGDIFVKSAPSSASSDGYNVEVISPFADSAQKQFRQNPFVLNPSDSINLLKRSVAMQTTNIYYRDSVNKFDIPIFKDTLPFYGRPEITYMLDDYKRFSTMEEVLREYVRPINVVLKDKKLQMSIFDEKYETIYRYAVLVLLDGVPLKDYNSIFNYDPFKVKKLDVVPRRYILGTSVYSGVASFQTYDSKFDGFEIDPSSVAIDYEGLQLKREFFVPAYSENNTGNKHLPDYRTTLMWKPDVIIHGSKSQSINIPTSDYKGSFKIIFQGISGKGEPIYAEKLFEVN